MNKTRVSVTLSITGQNPNIPVLVGAQYTCTLPGLAPLRSDALPPSLSSQLYPFISLPRPTPQQQQTGLPVFLIEKREMSPETFLMLHPTPASWLGLPLSGIILSVLIACPYPAGGSRSFGSSVFPLPCSVPLLK